MRTMRCLSTIVLMMAVQALHAQSRPAAAIEYSERAEMGRMSATAADVFGLKMADAKSGSKTNFVALNASGGVVFSSRTDSRTYFAYDPRLEREAKFAGSDDELLTAARRLLAGVGVPEGEIAKAGLLQEMTQTAQVDPQTKSVRVMEAKKGTRRALLTRSVEGIPVFSSRELLTLGAAGGIQELELHWPEIPRAVLAEAHRLQYIVRAGWKPPEQRGGRVESVEAGIVHSPAAAFVMDIVPVIRVIYAPVDEKIGVKSQLFFDRNGEAVPPPRQFAQIDEPCPAKPRPAAQSR